MSDEIRIWLGWRKDTVRWDAFVTKLAKKFIPATWKVMTQHGLVCYVPSVLERDKPAQLPDEVALLAYTARDAYKGHTRTEEGKRYRDSHGTLFASKSSSDWAEFPPKKAFATRRAASDGGPSLASPDASIVFIALSHPGAKAARARDVFKALGHEACEAVAVCEKGFTLTWLALDKATDARKLAQRLTSLVPEASVVAAHTARTAKIQNDGVRLKADESLRFTKFQPLWRDAFEGASLGSRWVGGHLNDSRRAKIWIDDGLHLEFQGGGKLSSVGVVTRKPIVGDFDACVRFEVQKPAWGTTFELAAIKVAPPRKSALDQDQADARTRSKVYGVHGVPPFVSSEFDELEGWRISSNRGTARNSYGRNVGPKRRGRVEGTLRLIRIGRTWTSYGLEAGSHNWIRTGQVLDMNLPSAVFLRLVAKSWKKDGLDEAPPNRVLFTDFELNV